MTDQAQPDGEPQAGAPQDTIEDKLARIETQLESLESRTKGREQKLLELETSELIVNRLMGWAKTFAFCVGIPTALFFVVLAVLFGKSWKELNDLVVVTRNSLQPILNEAQTRADDAKKAALAAQVEADKVRDSVETMSQSISGLQQQVTFGLQGLQELTKQMEDASSGVKQLRARVNESSVQVAQLSHQVEVVSNEKNLSTLRDNYPVFGERVVLSSGGRLDAQEKKPDDVYINLLVSMPPNIQPSQRKINDMDIATAVTSLQSTSGYKVFISQVGLFASSGRTSTPVAHIPTESCRTVAGLPDGPPCILYFRPELEAVAEKIKLVLTPAQAIPDGRLRYIDPVNTKEAMQELLEKSGLDIVVVLGQEK